MQQQNTQENQKFLKFLTCGIVANGATASQFLDSAGSAFLLENLRQEMGNNFNTLVVLNLGNVNFDVILDSETITTVNKNNGSFSFDWKDGVIFNKLELKNIDGALSSVSGDLRITVGRTGAI